MQISLCSEVIRELPFAEQCRFARETGYDGLELAPFTLSEEPHLISAARINELRGIARHEGIAITGLHWLLAAPEGLSITSEDTTVAARTREAGRRFVAMCHELGGTYLVHGSPAQRQLTAGRETEGRRRAVDYFAAMAEAAAEAGVTYFIEPLSRADTQFVTTVEEALAIIGEIGSASLSTMVDCYAAASNGEDIPGLLKRWVPQGAVRHVHFNDDNRRGPGEGGTDFGAILDMLERLDYSGHTAVEPFVYLPDGPACAARAIGYLRGLAVRSA
jgi:sugar phosphate isomerase/epimerase